MASIDDQSPRELEDSEIFESSEGKIYDAKPVRLSLHLIVKRHLPEEASSWPQDKIIDELNKLKRVRLDRENIGSIDSLELLSTQVTHLYLQSNRIDRIHNLECLPNLQVLILLNNQISRIEGIDHLQQLIFLDLAENLVEDVNSDEVPKSLVILNLSGNPCVKNPNHRKTMIKNLPKIKQLDGEEVKIKEKIAAGALKECDDEDGNDESDEEVEESDDADLRERPAPSISSLKQLPEIQSSVQDIATSMLLRSQERLENISKQHKRRVQEMTNLRIKTKIRPIPQLRKVD